MVACLLLFCYVSYADSPQFLVVTDRGNVFEIKSPALIPTTDVVSTPYVEFQRVGGLVANDGRINEAAQYNTITAGVTYIINNWGEGDTYGIPNWAPLEGEMRLSPVPHLHLRESRNISAGTPSYWPVGIQNITIQSGTISYKTYNNGTTTEYVEFRGDGRAVIFLDDTNQHYAINTICIKCKDTSRATIGVLHNNSILGASGGVQNSSHCTTNSINYTGCGVLYNGTSNRYWPSTIPVISHTPYPGPDNAILHVDTYDVMACPGAAHNNTSMITLDDTYFQLESHGCIMQNYQYQWHDGDIQLDNSLPLRPGLSIYHNTIPAKQPVIVVNLVGDSIKIQTHMTTTTHNAKTAFKDDFTVSVGTILDANSIVVLHDAFTHLGYYTISDIKDIKDHIRTYPQLTPNHTTTTVSHSRQPGASGTGGLLGADCIAGYKYCITVFDGRNLPSISSAAGVVYDPRNNEIVNGGMVRNHANVFVSSGPLTPYNIYYDSTKLNLIQAYGVIPVTGTLKIDELYLIFGAHDCSRYVDDSTTPHTWNPPSTGWLGLDYLQGEYGGYRTLIQIPILQGYGKACVKTHGSDEYRQYNMDNFFVQGAHASFGGTRHVTTIDNINGQARPYTYSHMLHMDILNTEVVLPGSGVRVLDLDVKISGSATIDGVNSGGGHPDCDWHNIPRTTPPRYSPTQEVVYIVVVEISIPAIGGYQTIDGLDFVGRAPLEAAQTPITVGSDCMHKSYVEWDFDAEHRTIPIQYSGGATIPVKIKSSIYFSDGTDVSYAGHRPDETLYAETIIERLSVRMH